MFDARAIDNYLFVQNDDSIIDAHNSTNSRENID